MTNRSGCERELVGAVAFDQLDAERAQLIAHRRVDVGVAAGDAVAGFARERGEAAHEGAADAEDVDVHGAAGEQGRCPERRSGGFACAVSSARLRLAATVAAMSSSLCAALTKPASYSAGAR